MAFCRLKLSRPIRSIRKGPIDRAHSEGQAGASMCNVGLRGSIAASVLERNGFMGVMIVLGGVSGWEALGFSVDRQMEK
jgi:rhodanese-related sulfurtransferase